MKNILNITAVLMSLCLIGGTASCSNSENSSADSEEAGYRVDSGQELPGNLNISEQDMPYGATMTAIMPEYDESLKIAVEFDNRYFPADSDGKYEEMYKLSDYFCSLNNIDDELMENTFYPPYLEYSYKQAGYENTEDYLKHYHDNLTGKLGDDFAVDYIIVSGLLTEADSPDSFTVIDDSLKAIDENLPDKVEEKKLVTLECTYNLAGEGSYSLNTHLGQNVSLYIYSIDGQIYIL